MVALTNYCYVNRETSEAKREDLTSHLTSHNCLLYNSLLNTTIITKKTDGMTTGIFQTLQIIMIIRFLQTGSPAIPASPGGFS